MLLSQLQQPHTTSVGLLFQPARGQDHINHLPCIDSNRICPSAETVTLLEISNGLAAYAPLLWSTDRSCHGDDDAMWSNCDDKIFQALFLLCTHRPYLWYINKTQSSTSRLPQCGTVTCFHSDSSRDVAGNGACNGFSLNRNKLSQLHSFLLALIPKYYFAISYIFPFSNW